MDFIKKAIVDKMLMYNKISLFFHEVPDFDALGACYALKAYIKNIYAEKEVEIIGLDVLDESFSMNFFEFNNKHVPNSFIAESLGVILDVANEARI
jgi:phosphoesterase RecJ-like protein